MKIDTSFMEFVSATVGVNFESKSLQDLRNAVERSAVHTFGWPVAVVIERQDIAPRPIKDGIETVIDEEGHREYWTINRQGQFFFRGELFENNRKPTHVFLDTRTNRVAEIFLRVGRYYELLGAPSTTKVRLRITHGNIKGKILGVGSPNRIMMTKRVCSVPEVSTDFELEVREMSDPTSLKANVYKCIRDLAEMFEYFEPNKEEFVDHIVDEFLRGRIV